MAGFIYGLSHRLGVARQVKRMAEGPTVDCYAVVIKRHPHLCSWNIGRHR